MFHKLTKTNWRKAAKMLKKYSPMAHLVKNVMRLWARWKQPTRCVLSMRLL